MSNRASIHTLLRGFYSRIFTIPKPSGSFRLIRVLSPLNKFLRNIKFIMNSTQVINKVCVPVKGPLSLHLKGAYYHIHIRKGNRKWVILSQLGGAHISIQSASIRPQRTTMGLHPPSQGPSTRVQDSEICALSTTCALYQPSTSPSTCMHSQHPCAHIQQISLND